MSTQVADEIDDDGADADRRRDTARGQPAHTVEPQRAAQHRVTQMCERVDVLYGRRWSGCRGRVQAVRGETDVRRRAPDENRMRNRRQCAHHSEDQQRVPPPDGVDEGLGQRQEDGRGEPGNDRRGEQG